MSSYVGARTISGSSEDLLKSFTVVVGPTSRTCSTTGLDALRGHLATAAEVGAERVVVISAKTACFEDEAGSRLTGTGGAGMAARRTSVGCGQARGFPVRAGSQAVYADRGTGVIRGFGWR